MLWKRETTDGGAKESAPSERQRHDLSFVIGLRRKTLRICVGKAKGKQPQTSQTERQICISEGFRLWAIIVLSCAYVFLFFIQQYTIIWYNLPHGQWCSTSRVLHLLILIIMNSTPNMHLPAVLRCFPCLLLKASLVFTHRENGKWVCAHREDEEQKQKSTALSLWRVSPVASCGLCVERSYQLTKMTKHRLPEPHSHTRTHTRMHASSKCVSRIRKEGGRDGWSSHTG